MQLLCVLGQIFMIFLFARIVLSWFYPFGDSSPLATVYTFVFSVTEPVLGPVRRAVPFLRVGAMAIDLSPILVILLMQLIYFRLVC